MRLPATLERRWARQRTSARSTRTASGPFTTDQAIALDDIRAAAAEGPERLASLLLPVDAGLDALPEVVATGDDVVAIARGQFVRAPGARSATDRSASATRTGP